MADRHEDFLCDKALRDEMTRYAKQVCAGIRSGRARVAAEGEIVDHLLCGMYDKALRGIPAERALTEAMEEFGSPSTLKQQYARIHNTLPPDFWYSVGRLCLRAAIAAFVSAVLWGIVESSGGDFRWYHLLPGVLIMFGLQPFYAVLQMGKRLHLYRSLKSMCRSGQCEAVCFPALPAALFAPSGTLRYVLEVKGRVLWIRVLCAPRRSSLRFMDVTSIAWITKKGGVGMVDRAPRRFNSTRIATLGDVILRPADFSFLLPDEWSDTSRAVDKLLVMLPFPTEVTWVHGTAVEEVMRGERVFDFSIHSRKSCVEYLNRVSREEDTP